MISGKEELYPQVEEERYLALLRAASVIANSDCNDALDTLTAQLRDVTPFEYLHSVAFDEGTRKPLWFLCEVGGKRIDNPQDPAVSIEDSPIAFVRDSGLPFVTDDWSRETRFQSHRHLLHELGITSTCALPLKRGDRFLGVTAS